MEQKIKDYIDSLVLTPLITCKVSGNRADGIYCVSFFSNEEREIVPLSEILVSSWDKEDDWKFKIRDAYMQCIALATGDTQILRDRYKADCGEWDDFD